ncbi:MAG: lipopolysaccharide biosynthesis protein [Xanthobacteraceae bacterium]|nr:lipopolysaccharide biosynthesis protein [Xanthobacteraceae bacterium]QYK46516.1 MAG: lipopolysaccharide biosynthesis protein [Xanthobacteraceae bacterium]
MRRQSPEMRAEADSAGAELDLSSLGRAVWRRKFLIVFVALATAVATFLVVNMITSRYKSEARVIIENRETAYNRPEGDRNAERDRTLVDAEAVQSQVQLALSRDLARKMIADLKLAERPEFVSGGASVLNSLLSLIGMSRPASSQSLEDRILERYYERLSVYQVDKSRVIAIEFQSEDPVFAARAANAIADGYIRLQQQAKQETIRQANLWLSGEIDRLRARVAEAESKVEEFRSKSNLYVGTNNTPLSAQQLAELNTQLSAARTRKADAETKARIIRGILNSGKPVEISEVLNSELIRRLNEQRVTLRAQLAEQSSTLLDQHPRIKELKAQLGNLEGQLRLEADKIARAFENDAKLASAQAESILIILDQQKKQATALGTNDVQLRALERDAKSQRDLLESYLVRYRDTAARETPEAVPADARVISRALPSARPHFPKKLPIVFIATLGMLLLTIAMIVTSQLLRGDVYRNATLVPAEDTDIPEAEPEMPKPAVQRAAPQVVAPVQPLDAGPLAAHVRMLGKGIVLVTRNANEPSSQLALDVARDLAGNGAKVVYADLDGESGVGAALVPGSGGRGLNDLLAGFAKFGEAIHRDPLSRAHVLGTGRSVPSFASLLTADRLAIVLGALAQTYEHVIVAVPPLATTVGANRLARFTRGVMLIAGESDEIMATAAADAITAKGFANVAMVTINDRMPAAA